MIDRLPETMRAAHFDAPGPPDVIHVQELPVPQPGPGEVLIKVAFAGVNRPDVIQRQGFYPPPPGASPLLGLEVSGEVAAVGEGVDPSRVGQRVCALTPGGGLRRILPGSGWALFARASGSAFGSGCGTA